MAWWQKKLLRYALSRTGLLDESALQPDKLDIALGKKNVVELKDVGLNITRISKLAQLPSGVRVETARILSLRLTVPADIYQSSIIAEVDGVELSIRVEDGETPGIDARKTHRPRSPMAARGPQHRKVHRRLSSPSSYDPGGLPVTDEAHIPTTAELAKSFLQEEPITERRELEASVAAGSNGLEESVASETSDDLGLGGTIGLPGFLAGFLQGIVDRLQISVKNLQVNIDTNIAGDEHPVPVTLRLEIGEAKLLKVDHRSEMPAIDDNSLQKQRKVNLLNVSLHLLSDAEIFSELSELPSRESLSPNRQRDTSSSSAASPVQSLVNPTTMASHVSVASSPNLTSPRHLPDVMRSSILTADSDRFADAGEEEPMQSLQNSVANLDIQLGDDNISWGSRRSQSNAPSEDLWKSMVSEDDLPESLLLDRAVTPRAQSPAMQRTTQDDSSPTWTIQSPGSWPRIDESPSHQFCPQSPGSWPLEQSRQSMFQSMTTEPHMQVEDSKDNKRMALEASTTGTVDRYFSMDPQTHEVEDLTVSKIFSHNEAESMYMSAMTHVQGMHVPGGWTIGSTSDGSSSPEDNRRSLHRSTDRPAAHHDSSDDDLAYGEKPYSTPIAPRSESSTPRPQSPHTAGPQRQPDEHKQSSKQLLHIISVSLSLPTEHSSNRYPQATSLHTDAVDASFYPAGMPGTFSAYSEVASSRHQGQTSSQPNASPSAVIQRDEENESPESISIEIGQVKGQVDIPSGRLLHLLASKAIPMIIQSEEANIKPRENQSNSLTMKISVDQVYIALRDSIDAHYLTGTSEVPAPDEKITLQCRNVQVVASPSHTSLRAGLFRTYLGPSCFLSFDRSQDLQTSTVITEHTPDIAIAVANKKTIGNRAVTEVSLEALPLSIHVDMPIIEETFSSFGGLSGILELGNSILSDSGLSSQASLPRKPNKGVRFEGDPHYIVDKAELKLNARLGAILATVQSSACAIKLHTSTVKAVYREQGAVATVEHVRSYCRQRNNEQQEAAAIDLTTMRLEYLFSPQDRDLERLLSLLTPSKDKYDNDDDILIDTLLRQRRKGAVARASITSIKFVCNDLASLSTLSEFGDELGKLSGITKYLPDDERPGLLTLVRIKEFEAHIPINDLFGKLHVTLFDAHCAHVGLPALLALSIGTIKASRAGQCELLHALVQLPGAETLPMVMARMLGDEVDPKIKVKLFNVCAECSVPIVLALSGLDKEASAEEVVAELTKSVADMAIASSRHDGRATVSRSSSSGASPKKLSVELLIHDSAVGLTPQGMNSKALFVLSDTFLSWKIPSQPHVEVMAEIRKAGLFVADEIEENKVEAAQSLRSIPSNTATRSKLTAALSTQGYVSIGSIMAATIRITIDESATSGAKSVDADVHNELLLLETCADSTQTLIAVLNGLTPPTPPSKQPQYLTEPMTIEDMVASFSGDAVLKPQKPPETLFDVEEEPEEDAEIMLDAADLLDDEDGLLAESTMTSSLYGPIGGIMDGDNETGEDEANDFVLETAESFLEEEDPFEMTTSPIDAPLSDSALLKELSKQCKPPVVDESIPLGNYEIEDLGFDALGVHTNALGTKHRFNTPSVKPGKVSAHGSNIDVPFKLRLRDLHIIWNIYDGYDWQRTRDGITQAVEQVETRAEQRKTKRRQSLNTEDDEESVIGDFLFNSIYIGVPGNHDAQELRRQINRGIDDMASETESMPLSGISRPPTTFSTSGRPMKQRPLRRLKLERSRAHKIAFELKGVSADVVVFPPASTDVVNSVDLRIKDFEIFDNVPTSTWRKFLTHLDDPASRELSKPMMHIELMNVRTLENFAASELTLHVTVLPLRLHVDQDALDFITRFFEFKDARLTSGNENSGQPFLQRVEVDTVDMCLDYKPKKVDYAGLRSGHTTEFMNFVILDAANIRLKHAIVYGIKGFEPLHKTLNDVWMPDIQRNQLPTVLAGLAPVRSLVNIGTGIRDVVAIPIREYKKDGRIVRSIQKGAFQFGKTTASELARLGAKVALGTQNLLQGAEGILTPSSASPSGRPSSGRRQSSEQGWQDVAAEEEERGGRALSAYANQPLGVFSGLRSARAHLEHDLLTARDALIAVQGEIMDSSSPGGAAAAVAKHAPTVILRPIIGTSRAVGTALLGVGNQIDRGYLRKIDDKYKRR